MQRLALGLLISLVIAILPALGNPNALAAPQLWVLCAVGVCASLCQPTYGPFTVASAQEDHGTALQILWSVYISQLMAVIESVYLRYPESFHWGAAATAGLWLMLAGLALRTWAVATLGRWFTWHISVEDDQPVVEQGPYRWIRHPSYTGAFLTYVGAPIMLQAWWAAGVSAVALALAFRRRVRHEERCLTARLGDRYAMYVQRVGAFLPWPPRQVGRY